MRKKSFTLIEILVAVGIIATIMVLVISLIVSIIHFNYKMSLQRQINREARNIMEMIVREGRLARGATGTPSEQAIQIGQIIENPPPKLVFDKSTGNSAINLREVPQLGRTFGLYPPTNGSLNIINQPYTVTGTPTVSSADIMIVLDQSGSMMEPYMDIAGPQPCMTSADGAAYPDYQSIVSNAEADYFQTDPGGAGFGCRDLNGNGDILTDEYQQTKYWKSRQVIREFINNLKGVDDQTSDNDFRIGIVVFARNIVELLPFQTLDTQYDVLYNTPDPNPSNPDGKNGVAGNTNAGPALERGFNNLAGSIADRRIEVFITDGKTWAPTRTAALHAITPAYDNCNYTSGEVPPLPMVDLDALGVDLRNYDAVGVCQRFARDYAWQMSKWQSYNPPTQITRTYVAGYGKDSSIGSLDAPLLEAMADFGGTDHAYLGSNLQQLFDDIGGILNVISYATEPSLGTPTTSASLFQVSKLEFKTNSDKTWVEITMEMKTPDYDLSTIPSWQKAKISLRTVFSTRAYP